MQLASLYKQQDYKEESKLEDFLITKEGSQLVLHLRFEDLKKLTGINTSEASFFDLADYFLLKLSLPEIIGLLALSRISATGGRRLLLYFHSKEAITNFLSQVQPKVMFSEKEFKNFQSLKSKFIKSTLREARKDLNRKSDQLSKQNFQNFEEFKRYYEKNFEIYRNLGEANPLKDFDSFVSKISNNTSLTDSEKVIKIKTNIKKFLNSILSNFDKINFKDPKIIEVLESEKFIKEFKDLKLIFPKNLTPEEKALLKKLENNFFKSKHPILDSISKRTFLLTLGLFFLYSSAYPTIKSLFQHKDDVAHISQDSSTKKEGGEPLKQNSEASKDFYKTLLNKTYNHFSQALEDYYLNLKTKNINYSQFVDLLTAYTNTHPYTVNNSIMFFYSVQKVKNTSDFSKNSLTLYLPKDYPVGVKFSKGNIEIRFDNGKIYCGVGTANDQEHFVGTYNNSSELNFSQVSVGFAIDEKNKKIVVYLNSPQLGINNLQKEFVLSDQLLKEIKNSEVDIVQWILLPKP
ncbi:MAG: hypothetical protein N3D10_01675 [Candidatus Micrarchaeota archaeon]|nr:hypothetical protein [Candidatus Micrarchaeota archaeon]